MILKWVLIISSCILLEGAPPEALGELNAAFREAYASAKAEAFNHQGTVLVVSGDELLLYRDQKVVATEVVRSSRYHLVKAVAHVPLAIRLRVRAWGDGTLSPERTVQLSLMRARIEAARREVRESFPEGAADQERILRPALRYLEGTLASGRVSLRDLDVFSAEVAGPIGVNIQVASVLELEALDRVTAAWRKEFLAGDWKTFKVVVIGSHMARDGELSWQFFSRLLGQTREGDRLVFAEEKWDTKDALGLLAGYVVDRDLGEAFFRDPERMGRDVLGDAAKKWLDSRPPAR